MEHFFRFLEIGRMHLCCCFSTINPCNPPTNSLFSLCSILLIFSLFLLYSEGASDTDSEVEDRVDGVKSWLSKNKGSAKNLSDDGSLKSSRSVLQP